MKLFLVTYIFCASLLNTIDAGVKPLLDQISKNYSHRQQFHVRLKVLTYDKIGKKAGENTVEYACKNNAYYSGSGDVVNFDNDRFCIHVNHYTKTITVQKSTGKAKGTKTLQSILQVQADTLLGKTIEKASFQKLTNGNQLVKLAWKTGTLKTMDIETDSKGLLRSINSSLTDMNGHVKKERIEYEKTEFLNMDEKIFSEKQFFSIEKNKILLKTAYKNYTVYDRRGN